MHCTKKATFKAIEKTFETITSKKAMVLALATWLLIHDHVGEEVWTAVALTFLGTIGITEYKAKVAELISKTTDGKRSSTSRTTDDTQPISE